MNRGTESALDAPELTRSDTEPEADTTSAARATLSAAPGAA